MTEAPKKDWFTAPMIMAYIALFGVMGTTAENLYSRIATEKVVVKSQTQNRRVDRATIAYVDANIAEVHTTCDLYYQALMYALPRDQKRKMERFLNNTTRNMPEPLPIAPPETTVPHSDAAGKPLFSGEGTKEEQQVVDEADYEPSAEEASPTGAGAVVLKKPDPVQRVIQAAEEGKLEALIQEKRQALKRR